MKKIIVLVLILVLGVYYIYSNDNSDKKIIKNNVPKIKVEKINIKKEVKTFEENIISDNKLENNMSDIKETEKEILVDSDEKNESILNTNIDFIDKKN